MSKVKKAVIGGILAGVLSIAGAVSPAQAASYWRTVACTTGAVTPIIYGSKGTVYVYVYDGGRTLRKSYVVYKGQYSAVNTGLRTAHINVLNPDGQFYYRNFVCR